MYHISEVHYHARIPDVCSSEMTCYIDQSTLTWTSLVYMRYSWICRTKCFLRWGMDPLWLCFDTKPRLCLQPALEMLTLKITAWWDFRVLTFLCSSHHWSPMIWSAFYHGSLLQSTAEQAAGRAVRDWPQEFAFPGNSPSLIQQNAVNSLLLPPSTSEIPTLSLCQT